MSRIIGIDLGTTNCCVAIMESGSVQIIPSKEGGRTTPSVVGFTENRDKEKLVGQIAKRQAITNATNTVYAVKRLIGRKFNSLEVQRACKLYPYEITEASNGDARIRINERDYSPPEISSIILQRLKASAEEFLCEEVTEAIITVPAYFDDFQRQATKDAGKIAGLNVQRIINEPTAAALAYGLGKNLTERIAVYDLGGGTFDISILEMNDGVFEVLSTCGDSFLGGEDFDQRIIDWLIETFKEETGIDLHDDRLALQRLKEAAERTKCELSSTDESNINLPFIAADSTGPKHLNVNLTRNKFEEIISDLVDKTIDPCQKALLDAKLKPTDIDQVLLVGGQTRSPIIHECVQKIFSKKPSSAINPDEVVAIGAAIQGAVLSGEVKDLVLLDVIPLSLGIEVRGGLFQKVVERNSTIPTRKSLTFTTVKDNQSTVEVHILQGEREVASANRSLGRFELVGIPPSSRGVPQIDVAFEIDADGIVQVSARDKTTGVQQNVLVTPSSGLSSTEIQELIDEALVNVETDRQFKEFALLRNKLEGLLQSTQRSFGEFGWMLSATDQEIVRTALMQSKEGLANKDKLQHSIETLENSAKIITDAIFNLSSDTPNPEQNTIQTNEN